MTVNNHSVIKQSEKFDIKHMLRLQFVYILFDYNVWHFFFYLTNKSNTIKQYDKTLITSLYHREILREFRKYIRIFYFRLQREMDKHITIICITYKYLRQLQVSLLGAIFQKILFVIIPPQDHRCCR